MPDHIRTGTAGLGADANEGGIQELEVRGTPAAPVRLIIQEIP